MFTEAVTKVDSTVLLFFSSLNFLLHISMEIPVIDISNIVKPVDKIRDVDLQGLV